MVVWSDVGFMIRWHCFAEKGVKETPLTWQRFENTLAYLPAHCCKKFILAATTMN
uniref:Uncharacterized protein n=1 Tax=Arundo donax TaxID=35708 RepID=A0A0A8ZZ29_ARUDO